MFVYVFVYVFMLVLYQFVCTNYLNVDGENGDRRPNTEKELYTTRFGITGTLLFLFICMYTQFHSLLVGILLAVII